MGETLAEVKLIANKKVLKKKLLVDTGSTYSWINADDLIQLGLKPTREEYLETIEGRIVKRKLCEVQMECLNKKTTTWVIFATPKDSEVLGLHALEGLTLEVDPVGGKLKKVKAIKAL